MSLKEKMVVAAAAALGLSLSACGPARNNGGNPTAAETAGGTREPGSGGVVREPMGAEASCGGGHSHK